MYSFGYTPLVYELIQISHLVSFSYLVYLTFVIMRQKIVKIG